MSVPVPAPAAAADTAEQVYRTYRDTVLRLAYARTGNKEAAEDLLQEVFVRYIKASPAFLCEEHRKAWLLRVTINCSNSFLSSAWHRRCVPLSEEIPALSGEASDVAAAVAALPAKYRTVIHLFYYEGYSVEEIASILHSRTGTVKSHLYRARQILKGQLKGEYSDV